jgi:hypothetical protein
MIVVVAAEEGRITIRLPHYAGNTTSVMKA